MPRFLAPAVLLFLATSAPALAQATGTSVPEPTDLTLFAIGLAGLIIGRRAAKRKD